MRTKTTNKRRSFPFLILPVLAILLALVVSNFLVVLAYVPSASRADTIPEGSILVGSRLAYQSRMPAYGEIVLFRHEETGNTWLIKRVIAVGGDTFAVENGTVYRNGEPLDEPYCSSFSEETVAPITVPDGMLILLGDHRAASVDARFWENPFVSVEDVVGQAVFLVFPRFSAL